MRVTVNRDRGVAVVSTLVSLWREKSYPFDRAILPQELIPKEIRKDRYTLSVFYFYACLLMRGGIESETAFRQLFKIHSLFPHLFIPEQAQLMDLDDLTEIVGTHIGWDKRAVATFWIENSKRLTRTWGGDPLSLFRNISTYDEAVEQICNKSRKGDRVLDDPRHAGFVGFQHKMTSMILYFYEWEGLLPEDIDYPPPVDFHHCRIFLGHRILTTRGRKSPNLRYDTRITHPIRSFLSWYTETHHVTTIELADALWLYSKLMCGEAPTNTIKEQKVGAINHQSVLPLPFEAHFKKEEWELTRTKETIRTCGVCPIRSTCHFSVPANPYFRSGVLRLTPRKDPGYVLTTPKSLRREDAPVTDHQILLFTDETSPRRR